MKSSIENKVFKQVRETIQKITFYTTDQEQKERNPLVGINYPAYLARRNAAYDRAVHLLREHIFSLSEEQRNQLYSDIISLLDTAIESTRYIASAVVVGNKYRKNEMSAIMEYFLLLNDTIYAAQALVKHELLLLKDEKVLSNFIGGNVSSHFQTIDDIFCSSEMNICQTIQELLDLAEPAIKRYRDHQKKALSKDELNRYNKSLAEFTVLYAKKGKITD